MHRGKLVILLMVAVGCLLGGIAVAFHHWVARRAIAWWGRDDVALITEAPRVDALRLAPAMATIDGETVVISGERYRIVERKDVTAVEGINHLRNSLLVDAHFNWDQPPAASARPAWAFAFEFIDGSKRLVVAFGHDNHVGRSDSDQILTITPVATGWSEFFAEQFPK
ncbi:MAG TPA: hypothetical protein VKB78_14145 [Pirellulales bacterium]|nr:hypothetical protein [Pirellulales bacterium]